MAPGPAGSPSALCTCTASATVRNRGLISVFTSESKCAVAGLIVFTGG